MNRKILFNLLFSFLVFNYCFAQKLEIKFTPAFLYDSRCEIRCSNDSCRIKFDIFANKDSTKIVWSESSLIPFESFKQFKDFFGTVEELYDDYGTIILDGIFVEGKYEDSNKIQRFKYGVTLKGTKKYELFKMFLATLDKYMKTPNTKRYLGKLKRYHLN